jgi:GDSL-like lipase/acylhydrolase family protein
MPAGTTPSPMAALKLKFLSAVAGIFIAILLAEVILRIYNPIPLPLRGLQIVLPSNKRLVFNNQNTNSKLDRQVVTTTNAVGFRGPNPPADPKAYLKIVAVGGSTTLCVMLADDKTWPARLDARLNAKLTKPVWLNNAGLDGHSTFGHMRLLEQFVMNLQPDYVLLLVGINDVGRDDLNEFDMRMELAHQSVLNRAVSESHFLSTLQVLWRSWRAFDVGVGHRWELDLKTNPSATIDDDAINKALIEHRLRFVPAYESRLIRLIVMLRERGIEPVFITQPVLYGETIDPETGVNIGPLTFGGKTAAQRWRELRLYNDATIRIGKLHNVLIIDLANKLPKDSKLYYDWAHYTNPGAELVADIVAAELVPFIATRLTTSN